MWHDSVRRQREEDPTAERHALEVTAHQLGISVEEADAYGTIDDRLDQPVEWPAGQAAARQVARWCAPHRTSDLPFVQPFVHGAPTGRPLCDLADLSSFAGDSHRLVAWLDCDSWAPDDLRLGVDACFGRLSQTTADRFRKVGLGPAVLPGDEGDMRHLAEILVIGDQLGHWSLHKRWQALWGVAATGEPPTSFSGTNLVDACPMVLSAYGTVSSS